MASAGCPRMSVRSRVSWKSAGVREEGEGDCWAWGRTLRMAAWDTLNTYRSYLVAALQTRTSTRV